MIKWRLIIISYIKMDKRFLQINTYRLNERKVKGVTSQTTQFDEEAVRELKKILENEFHE
jgi:hypothetical protein